LERPGYTREARADAIAGVALEDVRDYAARVFDRIYVEGVVFGNLAPDETRTALREALDTLGTKALPQERRQDTRVRQLPPGERLDFSRRLEVENSVIDLYYQAGQSEPHKRGALLIAGRKLGDAFYFNLRTQQQLAYLLFAGMGQMEETLSLNFIIQSGSHPAATLLERVEAFIPDFVESFRTMPEAEFERYRRAVIDAKLERPQSFAETARRLFWVAFTHDAQFDHVSEDIRAVEELTHQEVQRVLEEVLVGPKARRLLVRLVGQGHAEGPPAGKPVALPADARMAAAQ